MPSAALPGAAGAGAAAPAADVLAPARVVAEETLLAFDYGTKKIGIAIGNTLTRQATPLEIIHSEVRDVRFGRIAALLREWQPQRLIVGLALNVDGGEQEATARCRRFANQLHGRFNLPVVLVDERGSSMQAQALLGTNAPDDAAAAAVILQRYLDALPG
ncbi:Holliday junction resolvase RuvX [Bordetella sputigena]